MTDGFDLEAMEAISESPLTEEQLETFPRRSRVFILRRRLGMTQEEFSARFAIPLGTLRDWEQGRSAPDAAAQAYLKVIAAEPERVAELVA
ncbi:MAG: helix-turn-helix domain-containing protein [Rhizobiaceae bacterium]